MDTFKIELTLKVPSELKVTESIIRKYFYYVQMKWAEGDPGCLMIVNSIKQISNAIKDTLEYKSGNDPRKTY